MTQNVWLAIILSGMLGLAFFLIKKIRSDKSKSKGITPEVKGDKEAMVPVAILDDSCMPSRLLYEDKKFSEIEEIVKKHGSLDRVWTRDNKRLYALHKTTEGISLLVPSYDRGKSPRTLHDDTLLPEMEIIYDMREEKEFLQKYGMVLWGTAIMVLIMFLFVSADNKRRE